MRAGWALVRGGQFTLIGVAADADFCRLRGGGLRHSSRRRLTRKFFCFRRPCAAGGEVRMPELVAYATMFVAMLIDGDKTLLGKARAS